MASNLVFTADKTEIGEQQSFSIRRTASDVGNIWDASLPWDSLSDCIMTLTGGFATPAGQTYRGAVYQVRNIDGSHRPQSKLQWLDTDGQEYILSIFFDEIPYLASVLSDLADFEGVPLDLDVSEMSWRNFVSNTYKALYAQSPNSENSIIDEALLGAIMEPDSDVLELITNIANDAAAAAVETGLADVQGQITGLQSSVDAVESDVEAAEAEIEVLNALVASGRLSEDGISQKIAESTLIYSGKGLPQGEANNATAALKMMIDQLPDGATLSIPKGVYRLASSNTIDVNKSYVLDFNGSTILNGTTSYLMNFENAYDTAFQVTSVARTTLVADGTTWIGADTPGVNLTLTSAPPWSRGDLVKLYSDNPLQGQRDMGTPEEDPNNQAHYGQTFVVYSVSGTTVQLQGYIREVEGYTTNVRATRLIQNQVIVRNAKMDLTASALGIKSDSRSGFRFEGLFRPITDNVHVLKSHGAAFQMIGCFAYIIDKCSAYLTRNQPAPTGGDSASFGYGIYDACSEYGSVDKFVASNTRHAFTDDAWRGPLSTPKPARYGRTFGATIANSDSFGASATSWDCHLHGDSITFINCRSFGSFGGFSLRGIRHKILGGEVYDASEGVIITDEHAAGGWSWGHRVDNVEMRNVRIPYRAALRSAGPNAGVRETRPNYISGARIRDLRDTAMYVVNCIVKVRNIDVDVSGSDSANALFRCASTGIIDMTGVDIDFGGTAWTGSVFDVASASGSVKVRGYRALWSGTAPTALLTVAAGTGSYLRDGLVSNSIPSTFPAGNLVGWTLDGTSALTAGSASVTNATVTADFLIGLLADVDVVTNVLRWSVSGGDRTLPDLPNGRKIGQRLLIHSHPTSTSNIIINHGSTPGTVLIGGTSKTLAAGKAIELVWTTDKWMQVAPVTT